MATMPSSSGSNSSGTSRNRPSSSSGTLRYYAADSGSGRPATPSPVAGSLAELNATSTPMRLSPDLRGPAAAVGFSQHRSITDQEDDEFDLAALELPSGAALSASWQGIADDDELTNSLARLHDRPAFLHSHMAGPSNYRQPLTAWEAPHSQAPTLTTDAQRPSFQNEGSYRNTAEWVSTLSNPLASPISRLPPPDATSALLSALTVHQEQERLNVESQSQHARQHLEKVSPSVPSVPQPGAIRRHVSFESDLPAGGDAQHLEARPRASTVSNSMAQDGTSASQMTAEDLGSLIGRHHRQLSASSSSSGSRPPPPSRPPSYGARLDAPSLNRLQSTFFRMGGPARIPLKPEAALGLARLDQIHRSARGGSRDAIDRANALSSPSLTTGGLPLSSPSIATSPSSYMSALPSPAPSSTFSYEPVPYSDEWWRLNGHRFLSTVDASPIGSSDRASSVEMPTTPLTGQQQQLLSSDPGLGLELTPGKYTGQGPSPNNRKYTLYKTELCRSWEEKGNCRYGGKCQFAHGKDELRVVQRHPKFKTEICRTFWKTGHCPYAKRCCFIHTNPDSPMTAKSDTEQTPIKPPLIARVGRVESSSSIGSLGGHKQPSNGDRRSGARNAQPRSHDGAAATAQLAASKVREVLGAPSSVPHDVTADNGTDIANRKRAQTLQDSAFANPPFVAGLASTSRHQRGASCSDLVGADELDPRSPDSLGPFSPYSSQVTPPWFSGDLPTYADERGAQGAPFSDSSACAPPMSRFSSYSSYQSHGSRDEQLSDEQSASPDMVTGQTDSTPGSTVSTPMTQPFPSPGKSRRISPYDTPPRTPLRGQELFKSLEPELGGFRKHAQDGDQVQEMSGILEGLKLDLGGGRHHSPSTPQGGR